MGVSEAAGENCAFGGVAYTTATVIDYVCNGEPGADGLVGEIGPQGAIGPQGLPGLDGLVGSIGPQGDVGLQGPAGADGARGPAGADGLPGADGLQGEIGPQGVAGVDGLQGEIGLPGVDGAQGEIGPQGLAGDSGTSVVGSSLPVGDANCANGGSMFVAGLITTYACNGTDGTDGIDGIDGIDGSNGLPGLDGAVGAAGPAGDIGLTGLTGADGAQGDIGPQGIAGVDGTSVVGSSLSIGDPDCAYGGSMFVSGLTTTFACNGTDGIDEIDGIDGIDGSNGLPGLDGAVGAVGPQGDIGLTGLTGADGPQGVQGETGLQGLPGLQGDIGPVGPAALATFGYFYALMPGDNAATVAPGTAVSFPQDGAVNGIVGVSDTEFLLPTIGIYEVFFQVSIDAPGQLVLALDGVEQADTVVGRATGTSQMVNLVLVTTISDNTLLSVRNPTRNATALTITPLAGGTSPVSASLVVKQLL